MRAQVFLWMAIFYSLMLMGCAASEPASATAAPAANQDFGSRIATALKTVIASLPATPTADPAPGSSEENAPIAPSDALETAPSQGNANGPARDAVYLVSVYDPARDPFVDLQRAVAEAQVQNKRILLEVGGDWCGWCVTLADFVRTTPEVADTLKENFVVVRINVSQDNTNEAFLSQYPSISWYPHFFVLASDGTLLHSQSTAALGTGYLYDRDRFVAFLNDWAPGTVSVAAEPPEPPADLVPAQSTVPPASMPMSSAANTVVQDAYDDISSALTDALASVGDSAGTSESPADPLVIVVPSLDPEVVEQIENLAEQALDKIAGVEPLTNVAGRYITLDGLKAYEITAEIEDAKAGLYRQAYRIIVVKGDKYFKAVGIAGHETFDKFVAEFQGIIDRVRRRIE